MTTPGTTLNGKVVLEREIGRGAMGTVWLGRHLSLERTGALPANEVLSIVAQVCDAIAQAHALGVVHRDIEPANVFLVAGTANTFVKVLDGGFACVEHERGAPDRKCASSGGCVERRIAPEYAVGGLSRGKCAAVGRAWPAWLGAGGECFRRDGCTDGDDDGQRGCERHRRPMHLPELPPTQHGLQEVRRYAEVLGVLPAGRHPARLPGLQLPLRRLQATGLSLPMSPFDARPPRASAQGVGVTVRPKSPVAP